METAKSKPVYKYTIHERLRDFSANAKDKALIEIPEMLGISQRQFYVYYYAKVGDKTNIHSDKLLLLAKYFNCAMEELFTPEQAKVINNTTVNVLK